VVAAGFKSGDASAVRTNVPLVLLPDGAAACAAFQLKGDFAIVLVGPDGNIDYQTEKVLNMNRILEVMQNSYELQKATQGGGGSGR
jgi:predicted transcriptional regulator